MEIKLAENIRAFRKKRNLTQEQLAERLHVSVGVISKWELGVSAPEISLLMRLAELFDISVDVLLGYQMQDSNRKEILEELNRYIHNRSVMVPFEEVERYLGKYPHDFEIIYQSAQLYALRGAAERDSICLQRALELLQKADSLLEQNTDDEISSLSLQIDIADVYCSMGRDEEALELLKKNNPKGINDGQIGRILAGNLENPVEAIPYLSKAFLKSFYAQTDIVQGYMNAYFKQQRYKETLEIIEWVLDNISRCRMSEQLCSLDYLTAFYMTIQAQTYLVMEHKTEAKNSLRKAKLLAQRFDEAPNYDAGKLRFVEVKAATQYDDYGRTALGAIDDHICKENNETLSALWEEICHEA